MKRITTLNLKAIFYLLFFISFGINAQTVMLSEDFSEITAGDNTTTGGSSSPWTGNTEFPAGGILRAFQAGQAVRLGTSSLTGYITTMPLDLSQGGGNVTVTFDVKGWSTVEGGIKVTMITPTGSTEQTVTYTATIANPFENKTVTFTGGQSDSTIRIETTAKRAFIDNVVITTQCDDITEPQPQAQAFCGSATVADLEPGGAGIQWYSSGTGGTPLASTDVIVTGTYYVSQTEGTCESELVPVSITVNAVPGVPDVQAQTVCSPTTIGELVSNGSDVNWYTSPAGGNPLAPGVEAATSTYYVTQTVNGCESERLAVNITVIIVGIPQTGPQSFCNGAIVDDLEAEGDLVQWYTSVEGGLPLDPSEAIIEGTYYASQTIGNCESERVSVLVDIIEVDMPMGEANQAFTAGQTLADLTVTGSDIAWFSDQELTNPIPETTVLQDGATYYAVANEGECSSAYLAVTVQQALGVDSIANNTLKLYPNPVNDILNVQNGSLISAIEIFSLPGQKLKMAGTGNYSLQINVSDLPSGIYFLKIYSENSSSTIKFIKT